MDDIKRILSKLETNFIITYQHITIKGITRYHKINKITGEILYNIPINKLTKDQIKNAQYHIEVLYPLKRRIFDQSTQVIPEFMIVLFEKAKVDFVEQVIIKFPNYPKGLIKRYVSKVKTKFLNKKSEKIKFINLYMNRQNLSHDEIYGKVLGYPACCVKVVTQKLPITEKQKQAVITIKTKYEFTGFTPCLSCASKIIDQDMSIYDILREREEKNFDQAMEDSLTNEDNGLTELEKTYIKYRIYTNKIRYIRISPDDPSRTYGKHNISSYEFSPAFFN